MKNTQKRKGITVYAEDFKTGKQNFVGIRCLIFV